MSRVIAALLVLGLSSSIAMADYYCPPGWDNDPYFTHQSWDFLTPDNPIAPDGIGPLVTSGWPSASINSAGIWTDQLGSGDGGWKFYGPVELTPLGPKISLYIPNIENPDRTKEIWVQASFAASFAPTLDNIAFRGVVPDGTSNWEDWTYIAPHDMCIDNFDPTNNRARVTARIDITPQPEYELIYISFGIPKFEWVFLDEVDVYTRCIVPEPSVMAMLAIGCLGGLVGFRARKRVR